ncbi:MAG: SAM-dependent chlorinase/fluorinase [Thermoplasmata archaeon]|nr:MAG: SAM-dependent chlorinase/fluorinase [Thermoplasmata archaeon]
MDGKCGEMKIITLTTDIGWEYAAQMKGVIFSINPDVKIVDITHNISPQNILEGAFILSQVASYFHNAIHIGVVDPGVGTERRAIIVDCEPSFFVGPDNGLLIPAAKKMGIKGVYEITEKKCMMDEISSTFHGRDIFAPIAAHLSLGKKASMMGKEISAYEEIEFGKVERYKNEVRGKIIFIDSFGNIITNIPTNMLNFKQGELATIVIGGKEIKARYFPTYGYAEKGEILITPSSFKFFEVSCREGNASSILHAKNNESIVLRKSA